jgi:hypothetical protein
MNPLDDSEKYAHRTSNVPPDGALQGTTDSEVAAKN